MAGTIQPSKHTTLGVLMKTFVTTCFILLGISYALPFQAPVPGNYQCVSSEESPFDANAQDTGATLTINADGSYTFTTSSASENGSVQANEETAKELEQLFQNGSTLSLQPSSGSTAYEGLFATDKQGGMYVFVFTNTTTLRCQSPGADIASAFDLAAQDQVATVPEQTTPETQTNTLSGSYDEALVTVWTSGKLAVMTKEWCDTKVPELQTANAQALETWQAEQLFYDIEEKLEVYTGTTFSTLEGNIAATREGLFAQFDKDISDPASYCQNLLTELRNHYNLRQLFPNEYAVIERYRNK
jgi:hypothetical protein